MTGRPTTKKSKKIMELLEKGKSIKELERLGYSRDTVIYNRRKLFKPEAYQLFLTNRQKYFKARRAVDN